MASDLKIRFYNTLTRAKEEFVPLDAANVRMYVCGPTVYDFAHIGNARPAIVFDVLFRLLRQVYGEKHVTYVRNITDVDDKINARAARDFPDLPLNEAIRRVTESTAAQYQKDTAALGCLPPTVQPRATDNIPQMQALIEKLIAGHHAYEAAQAGEVLFDVSSMHDYGALSGRDLQSNLAGARVEVEPHKHNAADFVLWKKSSQHEPGWDSPWGRGRPGWHIECSAMSERYLGEVFDIHAGGLDLIFPHHENEIAQSRCAHGTDTMARYWLHNGFLQVEGQKMSKSLGNFVTIHELLETDKMGGHPWLGEALRLAMLSTQYRNPIDWTQKSLNEASEKLRDWATTLLNTSAASESIIREHQNMMLLPHQSVIDALCDDLNSPLAIAALDDLHERAKRGDSDSQHWLLRSAEFLGLMKGSKLFAYIGGTFVGHGNRMASPAIQKSLDDVRVLSANGASSALSSLAAHLSSEGVKLHIGADGAVSYEVTGSADWTHLIEERLAALNAKDFKRADEIRAALLAEGIQLMDSRNDAGQRVTTWEVKR